jgi:hypothetical protein
MIGVANLVQVVISNLTGSTLTLTGDHLSHGDWTTKPPGTIAPNAVSQFGSRSKQFSAMGTQGSASYTLTSQPGSVFKFEWKDRVATKNAYSYSTPSGFQCSQQGGNGYYATIFFILYEPLPVDWMQANIGTLGNNTLRELCIPGSHDAGMSKINGHTYFANACNTLTQTEDIAAQLLLGARFFDLRPVIADGEDYFYTGHYSKIDFGLGHTYQGADGQPFDSIIRDINFFTQGTLNQAPRGNSELIVLNLSHDLDTTLGNASYAPFTQTDWDRLLGKLSAIRNLFVVPSGETNGPPAAGDISIVTVPDGMHVFYEDTPYGGSNHQNNGSWIFDLTSPTGSPGGWQVVQLTGAGGITGGPKKGASNPVYWQGSYVRTGPAAVVFGSEIYLFYVNEFSQIFDLHSPDGGATWFMQQLTGAFTKLPDAPNPASRLTAVAFASQSQMHVFYSDAGGLIWDITSSDGETWLLLQITGQGGILPMAQKVIGNLAVVEFSSQGQLHVCFTDVNDQIWDVWSTDGLTWQLQQLTAAQGSSFTGAVPDSLVAVAFTNQAQMQQMHVFCIDGGGQIWDVWSPDATTWQVLQVTGPGGQLPNAPPAAGASLSAVTFDSTLKIFYRDQNSQIFLISGSDTVPWNVEQVTGLGSPALIVAPPAPMQPVIGILGSQMHVCYRDGTGIIQDVVIDSSTKIPNLLALNGPDLTRLPLNEFIGQGGGSASVVVVVDPGASCNLGNFQNNGFFMAGSFPTYNQYANTNDLDQMVKDQLYKLAHQRGSPDGSYFLLSWTLTQSTTEILRCLGGVGPSIVQLADTVRGPLYGDVLPNCNSQTQTFPNILYVDDFSLPIVTNLAMIINNTIAR